MSCADSRYFWSYALITLTVGVGTMFRFESYLLSPHSIVHQIMRESSGSDKSEIEKKTMMRKFYMGVEIGSLLNHSCNIILYCLCNNTYRYVRT